MKAHDLAKKLLEGPDLEVSHIWDGAARTSIEFVWVAKGGRPRIVTADCGEVVYSDVDRPISAPTVEEDACWRTPEEG